MKLVVACALALSAISRPLAADGRGELLAIVHPHNHAAVTAAGLESIFLRRERHWPDGGIVVPLNLVPESAARQAFDRVVLGMSPDEVARHWLDQRIRDGTSAPRELADPSIVVKLVAHLDGAIGYVPSGTELQGVVVIARIVSGGVAPP